MFYSEAKFCASFSLILYQSPMKQLGWSFFLLIAVNYFHKKAPFKLFVRALIRPFLRTKIYDIFRGSFPWKTCERLLMQERKV